MTIEIGSKVKHIPSGNIITIKSKTKVFIQGNIHDPEATWMLGDSVKVRISECESYIDPPKEKSFYDKMRERNMEDAKNLSPIPKDVDQHILWLKMAVTDRVEKIENLASSEIQTFRSGEKFGFTEQYVNILMHYAYEAGKKRATDDLTSSFNKQTARMKAAIEGIVSSLDANDLLPECDCDDRW
jgi:hypothetical protein